MPAARRAMAKFDPERLKAMTRPQGMPFRIGKIGHVVLHCRDIERTVRFYTDVLGFKVSDVYPDEMVPGGMVFMRCSSDHHGIGFVGCLDKKSAHIEINHLAFEVGSLDEVLRARDYLKSKGVEIEFEGRRRAGSQISLEFSDPDGHRLEIFWGLDVVGTDDRIRPASEWKWAHSLEEAIADPCVGQDTTVFDRSLLKERSEEEKRRNLEYSLKTQAAKLGQAR
jgi:catechol 2,3-dioxygenase-like lactoylglutathione lyase family enzyme